MKLTGNNGRPVRWGVAVSIAGSETELFGFTSLDARLKFVRDCKKKYGDEFRYLWLLDPLDQIDNLQDELGSLPPPEPGGKLIEFKNNGFRRPDRT